MHRIVIAVLALALALPALAQLAKPQNWKMANVVRSRSNVATVTPLHPPAAATDAAAFA